MKRRLTYVYCLKRVLVGLPVGVAPLAGVAQEAQVVSRAYATRAALEEQLQRPGEGANSPAYSAILWNRTRLEADLVRRRLAEGDFQIGDRVFVPPKGGGILETETVVGAIVAVLSIPRSILAITQIF